MHYSDTRTHHHNITSQFHHQEQSSFCCAENKEDYRGGREPGIFADAGFQARAQLGYDVSLFYIIHAFNVLKSIFTMFI